MQEEKMDTKQTLEVDGDKIKVITVTKIKISKKDDLTHGVSVVSFEDKGDHYIKEVISDERLPPEQFLKMTTSVRQQRDNLLSSKKIYDEYDDALERFKPFIDKAKEMRNKNDKWGMIHHENW